MDAHRRQELTRVAAPVAFLLVVTVAVLLVRSGLHHDSAAPVKKAPAKQPQTHAGSAVVPVATGAGATVAASPAATAGAVTATASGHTYTVVGGDTLGSIATKEKTTVDALLAANPGVDPTGLQIGDTISVP
jgi:LysM repeat protein